MLRFAGDEDLDGRIVRALRRSIPSIELITVAEAGLRGSSDPAVLDWTAAEGRVLLSQDVSTMPGHVYSLLDRGRPTPGVLLIPRRLSIAEALGDLQLIARAGRPADFSNRLRYLPL